MEKCPKCGQWYVPDKRFYTMAGPPVPGLKNTCSHCGVDVTQYRIDHMK
jgi:uncharacterized OB-fold protein